MEVLPNVQVETIQEQGAVQGRNWQRSLVSRPITRNGRRWRDRLTSGRRIRFVLMDESVTRLKGNPRLQPHHVLLPYPMHCPLTLSHTGYIVGTVYSFLLISQQDREALQGMGIKNPDCTEGQWILSEAGLCSSPLADKTWQGLQEQIFTHTCPVLLSSGPRTFSREPSPRDLIGA